MTRWHSLLQAAALVLAAAVLSVVTPTGHLSKTVQNTGLEKDSTNAALQDDQILSLHSEVKQKAWRLRNRCKHVGVPVHVVTPMHVGSAVHVGAAVHAVHVDSAKGAGPMAMMLWHNGYVTN